MITEDYVSFEVAKLLKEKGFDEESWCVYDLVNKQFASEIGEPGDFLWNFRFNHGLPTSVASAPTLQKAMKWLRKEHNLAISVSVTVDGWHSYVSQIKLDSEGFVVDIIDGIDDGNIPNYDTYEEACEAAIKYCLEKLI